MNKKYIVIYAFLLVIDNTEYKKSYEDTAPLTRN